MDIDLTRLTNDLQGLLVAVVGDPILDVYLNGNIARLCREAPIPVVQLHGIDDVPGGAGNVAVNAAALGAEVRFYGFVGDDLEGTRLKRALQQRGVSPDSLLVDPDRRTPAKHRLLSDSQILARFDQGVPATAARYCRGLLLERLRDALRDCDAVIVSDYGYGSVSDEILELLTTYARAGGIPVVADGRDFSRLPQLRPTAMKPSYEEVLRLLGETPPPGVARADWISEHSEAILSKAQSRIVAVTLDTDGAVILERDRPPVRTYARPARPSRSTGSGDTFVTALTLALAAGADTPEAAEIASAAASVVVAKDGTAACTARELREAIAGSEKRLVDTDDLGAHVAAARAQGRRIVFTNGCFDILHRGHVTLLSRAKSLGDVLIVGVNSDASVRQLKGPTRPINLVEDRINVLTALSCVDYVIPFDADSPRDLIQAVRPDIYVKGGDYTHGTLPEAALVESLGGTVCILPLIEDRSTTGIIARIRGAA
jgi:D-beta-D-heptose 7-phosphate kinase / D-beta-D-heptose 1-phosphate adenosyltransferase